MKKFDTVIWRINGIIILIFSAIAIVLAGYVAIRVYKMETGTRYVSDMVKVDDKDTLDDTGFMLGDFRPVAGSNVYMAPLQREQKYDQNYYSKSSSSRVDYLFYDGDSGNSSWLLGHRNWLILDYHRIVKDLRDKRDMDSHVSGFFFLVVKEDTDGDKRLSRRDNVTVIFSNSDGSIVQPVISGALKFLGFHQQTEARSVLFADLNGSVEVFTVDNLTGKVLAREKVKEK